MADVDLDLLGLDKEMHCSALSKMFDDVPHNSRDEPECENGSGKHQSEHSSGEEDWKCNESWKNGQRLMQEVTGYQKRPPVVGVASKPSAGVFAGGCF